jgi:hypothetical protein
MSLFPRARFPVEVGFEPDNTENLAFLPPAALGLAPINGKLIGRTRAPITGISRR